MRAPVARASKDGPRLPAATTSLRILEARKSAHLSMTALCVALSTALRVFSSEVETGSREENASEQKARAPVLILSEPEKL